MDCAALLPNSRGGEAPLGLSDGEGVVGVSSTPINKINLKKKKSEKKNYYYDNNFFSYSFAYIRFFAYLRKIIELIWSI